jgi:hypothetical protein
MTIWYHHSSAAFQECMSNLDSLVTIEMNPYTRGYPATKGSVS